MRLASIASIAILALSTAALAQVAAPGAPQTDGNIAAGDNAGSGNATMPADTADNMLDNSASPPPTEPK